MMVLQRYKESTNPIPPTVSVERHAHDKTMTGGCAERMGSNDWWGIKYKKWCVGKPALKTTIMTTEA